MIQYFIPYHCLYILSEKVKFLDGIPLFFLTFYFFFLIHASQKAGINRTKVERARVGLELKILPS